MRSSKVHTAVVIAGVLSCGIAEARVYRCSDAGGQITYSQSPCPADQQSDQVRGVSAAPRQDKELCALARDLAATVFADMSQGTDPASVLDQYGGVNYINAPTLGVINFAASLRYNEDLTPQRVGSLTFSRCREGGFGKLNAGDLPKADIDPDSADRPAVP